MPERSIGASFRPTKLTDHGFFRDWTVDDEWNLCTAGGDAGKVGKFQAFMESRAEVLICTHATLRFAYDKIGAAPFANCLLAVDEFHHASADADSRLGEVVRGLIADGRAHIVAMTGSYFRGDSIPVLRPEDEERFTRISYTYYEQLNGYTYLKTSRDRLSFLSGPLPRRDWRCARPEQEDDYSHSECQRGREHQGEV